MLTPSQVLMWVSLGAVPGALVRWLLGLTPGLSDTTLATLAANLLGCLVLGGLSGVRQPGQRSRLLVGVGFCGSLSTFSSWILELQTALGAGALLPAAAVLAANLGLGLAALLLGRSLGRHLPVGAPRGVRLKPVTPWRGIKKRAREQESINHRRRP